MVEREQAAREQVEKEQEARKAAEVNNLPFIAVFENGKFVAGQPTSKEEKVVELINKLV